MSLKILIVDDDIDKATIVAEALRKVSASIDIRSATNATEAKRLLRSELFDLVVLDVALPLRDGELPSPSGGIDLLKEITSRSGYLLPRHFVGLTAFREVYEQTALAFSNELWLLLFFDRSSEEALDQLSIKVRHIIALEQARARKLEHQSDICVVTALHDPELMAVLQLEWGWTELQVPTDATVYHRGRYKKMSGVEGSVVAARAPNMGMAATAVLATKMAMHFKPRVLVMCGICAGKRNVVQIGDVVVANPSWDYGSGKHSVHEGKKVFEPLPQPFNVSTRLRGLVDRLELDEEALGKIRARFGGEKPPTVLTVRAGPLASGAAVLADATIVDSIKGQQNRKLLGIEMEAYGLMAAAADLPEPRPEAIVLKGVSDFADETKDDRYRHYAAYVSARILEQLATRFDL